VSPPGAGAGLGLPGSAERLAGPAPPPLLAVADVCRSAYVAQGPAGVAPGIYGSAVGFWASATPEPRRSVSPPAPQLLAPPRASASPPPALSPRQFYYGTALRGAAEDLSARASPRTPPLPTNEGVPPQTPPLPDGDDAASPDGAALEELLAATTEPAGDGDGGSETEGGGKVTIEVAQVETEFASLEERLRMWEAQGP